MILDLLSTNPDWIQTVVRLILGIVFFAHGAQKLLGWFGGPGLKETLRMLHETLGLPAPMAFLAVRRILWRLGTHRRLTRPCRGRRHRRGYVVRHRDGRRPLRALPQLVW